ncbi:uncharacterized protein SAMN04487907_107132 [Zunongwangia mangrovi]|uniref:DUF418 domain-containing protein n=2 Tax=Zunongwangia mangrovi TaxID=1334022 RepID=A0A1I1LAN9_9FLAO|nr:uncharacterized protein SAMN04487907_107132 [Zunongwangia mangrovi]
MKSPNLSPVKTTNRIEILDIWRGFAVFGIFMVNIEIMNSVFINQDLYYEEMIGPLDSIIIRLSQLFFYNKFFPIFSFLFGLGIAMQLEKLKLKKKSRSFILKRMLILFIIGILHITLIWGGDVIHLYAILGVLISILYKLYSRCLLLLACYFLLFPFYDIVAEYIFSWIGFSPENILKTYNYDTVTKVLRNGSYTEALKFRILEYFSNVQVLFVFLAPMAFSMMLLGTSFVRSGKILKLREFILKNKNTFIWLAIITNVYRIIFLFILPNFDIYRDDFLGPIWLKLMIICDTLFGLFYMWFIAWLWFTGKLIKALKPLASVGKMALSNYILQSFIGVIIFNGIGFSMYQKLNLVQCFFTVISVFIFQLILSKIWLQHFKFGPLEWCWRCLSYGKLFSIKKEKSQ